jgi:hypothetical protein
VRERGYAGDKARRWSHGQKNQDLAGVHRFGDSGHHLINEEHREGVKNTTSSPRAKSKSREILVRRATQDGGRLRLCHGSGCFGAGTVMVREHDGVEGAWARLI